MAPWLAFAAIVVAYALVSRPLDRIWITPPIVFMAAGIIATGNVFGIAADDPAVHVLAEITLVLVLFTDAVRIDLSALRQHLTLPFRLLFIGLPLSIASGAVAARFVLGLDWPGAFLLAAILAPTDAALGQAVVDHPAVPVRIRQTLNIESGLNDGIVLPAVVALAAVEGSRLGLPTVFGDAGIDLGGALVVGAVVGALLGAVIDAAARRSWMDPIPRQLAAFAVPVIAFLGAEEAGVNGFIAAFTAGVAFGWAARGNCSGITDFARDEGELLELGVFAAFGAAMAGPAIREVTAAQVGYALMSLLVVRPLAVFIALTRSHLRGPSKLFLGWFGPRGLASILFVLVVTEHSEGQPLTGAVSITVAASIVLHGLSSRPLADRYARWIDRHAQAHEHETMTAVPTRRASRWLHAS